jgi:hypothetical protein
MIDPLHDPALGNDLVRRSAWAAAEALDGDAASPRGDAFERAWMRIVDAYDALHQAGIACSSEDHMFRLLRTGARRILLTAPTSRPDCWLVPATPRDVTACHLVAVSLLRRGEHVRLWPWHAPVPGASMTVGANWRALITTTASAHGDDASIAASA